MDDTFFLQEMTATVAFFDMRGFSKMTQDLNPVDVAIALGRFYEHVEESVIRHGGRLVKFISDAGVAVFSSYFASQPESSVDKSCAVNAVLMAQDLLQQADAWANENMKLHLPAMNYSLGLASGNVLYGEIGTQRQRAYDVLGNPVVLAVKLAKLATVRNIPHMITHMCFQASKNASSGINGVELEGAELGGQWVRLYRLHSADHTSKGDNA